MYDRDNRKATETLIGFQPVTWTYDQAGNVTSGGRRPTNNIYDALNRRVIAAGSETATYGYDAVGHLVFANNPYARIARTYNANGTLATDTLRIATADSTAGDFSQHVYGIRSGYDLDGHRIWVKYPGTLAPAGHDSAAFAFDRQTGALDTVRDVFGNQFRYKYDADGRMIRLTMFAQTADSLWETDAYDADSRLVRRQIAGSAFTYHSDSLLYNRRGRVVKNALEGDSTGYSTFGNLKYAFYATASGPEQISDDALGNHASMWVPANTFSQHIYTYSPGSDRDTMAVQPSVPTDTTKYYYGNFGETGEQLDAHTYFVSGVVTGRETRDVINDYNAQQLLIRTRYSLDSTPVPGPQYKSYHRAEFYRYDALGRRIFQRLVLDTGVVCMNHDQPSGCKNQLTRTVWDGEQILYEIRAPGDTTGTAQENDNYTGGPLYGNVGYVEGLGVDRPLELFKGTSIALPFTNWRGLYDIGACPTTVCGGSTIEFPQGLASSYGAHPPQAPTTWWGSIITGSQDGSGYQYKRNRYYDPTTGRFTQEDPIGLAGGLNTYGFADGDPVSYGDPFGLCDDPTKPDCNSLQDAFNNALGLVGNFINSITGGLATLRDFFTHSPAGTSQTRAAQFMATHRSPVDVSVRVSAPGVPFNASGGTDGFKMNATPPADEASVMLDATFTNPFASPGPQWSLGKDFPVGEGLEGGFAANFSGGQLSGFTGSIGFGFGSGEGASKGLPIDLSLQIFPIQF